MTWYEFLAPAVVIALLVRVEAVFVGEYWSWLEMFPEVADEGEATRTERRKSLWRRVALPGVIMFAAAAVWPGTFDEWAAATVGIGAAALLLWPLVFHGLPWGVRASDWQLSAIYGGLVAAFGASAWIGAHVAQWGMRQEGGLAEVLRENIISLAIGGVIVGAATTTWEVASTQASRRRQGRRNEF